MITRQRSQNLARLKDLFPNWSTGRGIFGLLTNMPWSGVYESIVLDIEYFGNHSGNKFCAPLLYHYIDSETSAVTDEGRTILASVITAKYANAWKQLWATYDLEYSPLDNVSIQETLSRTDNRILGGEEADNNNRVLNTEMGVTHGLKTTQESSSSNKTDSGTFGFNSTSAVPSDTESQLGTMNSTISNSGVDTTSTTGTIGDSRSKTRDLTDNETENWTKTKSGRTFSDLPSAIAASRSLWLDDFFSKVFDDIDLVMTVPVYDDRGDDAEFEWHGSGGGGEQQPYVLPVASLHVLGGVKGPAKTNQELPVYVDENGFLFVDKQNIQPDPYVLPVASDNVLGGVMAAPYNNEITKVTIDSNGRLWSTPVEILYTVSGDPGVVENDLLPGVLYEIYPTGTATISDGYTIRYVGYPLTFMVAGYIMTHDGNAWLPLVTAVSARLENDSSSSWAWNASFVGFDYSDGKVRLFIRGLGYYDHPKAAE